MFFQNFCEANRKARQTACSKQCKQIIALFHQVAELQGLADSAARQFDRIKEQCLRKICQWAKNLGGGAFENRLQEFLTFIAAEIYCGHDMVEKYAYFEDAPAEFKRLQSELWVLLLSDLLGRSGANCESFEENDRNFANFVLI